MKFVRLLVFALFFAPFGVLAAPNEFTVAAQLLAAAKNADIQQVQVLINNGANINYVDSTGLSLVCTALMNNDLRAAQILQMYGADASQCDRQIKNYKTQNSPGRTGGLFGGLSTAQGLTLAAAGAAVVVGGLYFLTDVFDHDNHNHSSSSGSGGHGGGGSGGGSSSDDGTAWSAGALPYGPAMVNAAQESANYANNLALYYTQYDSEQEETPYYRDFYIMNHYTHNYLLLMRGYSALARGYLGLRTLRNSETHAPISLNGAMYGAHLIEGGRPVNVALVTANGVNASDESSLRNKYMVWTGVNANNAPGGADPNTISSKYYNDKLTINSGGEFSVTEDPLLLAALDLSGTGTAIHNGSATADDNLLGKIVGGGFDNPYGDFAGFMPNGQMTIYRTGGGKKMIAADGSVAGTYDFGDNTTIDLGDTMTFAGTGVTATVSSISTLASNDDIVSIVWSYGDTTSPSYYYGYLMNNLYYVDFDGDGMPDAAYLASGGDLLLTKQVTNEDYYNYTALKNAATKWEVGDAQTGGRSRIDIIANADVIEPLHSRNAYNIDTMNENNFDETVFGNFIASMYGDEETGSLNPRSQAQSFFSGLGSSYNPLVIFSTGASIQNTGAAYADEYQVATFENAAPLVYDNLEHLFMSIVSVASDTSNVTSISPNSDTNPDLYTLSRWYTTVDGEVQFYKSRICGFAGQPGAAGSSIDPWCFASVGVTDEMAVASAAGAVGALRSAFYYMTPQQIFTLLALTADGPYLNRLTSGTQLNQASLATHLRLLYDMPSQFTNGVTTDAAYLEAFKRVFGYGVINLERATTPGTNLYHYTNGKIVSSAGNAYWRAAINTNMRMSPALNLGRGAINIAAYDMLESIDGSMRLPRIWESNVSFGNDTRSALYMGDVLSDLHTRDVADNTTHIGNMSFGFTRSERLYNDNMGGMDDMHLSYAHDNWKLSADYQRYLTNGESRFYGMANPVLSLASRATTGGIDYSLGKWSFGARGFTGAITDEGLLENDPTISSLYEPMRLGTVAGAQSEIGWNNEKIGFKTSVGSMHEDNTMLGAYATGLLEIGGASTNYVDVDTFWKVSDMLKLRARATFAHTTPNMASGTIIDVSELNSNAFAFGADIENMNFGVSLPLAVYDGHMNYDYANYEIVDTEDGRYDLAISDFGTRHINMSPMHREVRLNATYRHNFGPFTDGAIGFIYRINPNNTNDFGNESIFMMKMSHLIGI